MLLTKGAFRANMVLGLLSFLLVLVQPATAVPVNFTWLEAGKKLQWDREMYEVWEGPPSQEVLNGLDTFIGIINATPYPWTRVYSHYYQMRDWDKWPQTIEPGETVEVLAKRHGGGRMSDSAAEVRYKLEGTSKPMGLQIEYRRGHNHDTVVRLMDELQTLNNEPGTEHVLGFLRRPGGTGFVLAGSEEAGFISNNAPPGWMQASLASVGHLPLRHLCLPRAHHAGMWKAVRPIGLGLPRQTLTQTYDLWEQLVNGGVRVLDVRAHKWHAHFREAHVAHVKGMGWHGMFGASLPEMIDIVNRFTSAVPGELIIWDLHADARSATRHFAPLNPAELAELYELLRRLNHRVVLPDNDVDVTKWPLNRFIANGTSAVLVRVPHAWVAKSPFAFPGASEGFVTSRNYPTLHHWSNKNRALPMVQDQLRNLAERRKSRDDTPVSMDWIITQHSKEVIVGPKYITQLSFPAWRALYYEFWSGINDRKYPNWIAMDHVHHSQLKGLVMTINLCLGARKCGGLGGKVPSLEGQVPSLEAKVEAKVPILEAT